MIFPYAIAELPSPIKAGNSLGQRPLNLGTDSFTELG